MSISDKFNSLDTIKSQIKQAIIDQGVEVSSSDGFATYPAKIAAISGGGVQKFLINNGENGWYTVDNNNWCKLYYIGSLQGGWTYSHTDSYTIYTTTTYQYYYYKFFTLPVTFSQLWIPTCSAPAKQNWFFSVAASRVVGQTPGGNSTDSFGNTVYETTHMVTAQIQDSNLGVIRLESTSLSSNSAPTGGTIYICVEGEITTSSS